MVPAILTLRDFLLACGPASRIVASASAHDGRQVGKAGPFTFISAASPRRGSIDRMPHDKLTHNNLNLGDQT
jgi:hypothetical protein